MNQPVRRRKPLLRCKWFGHKPDLDNVRYFNNGENRTRCRRCNQWIWRTRYGGRKWETR